MGVQTGVSNSCLLSTTDVHRTTLIYNKLEDTPDACQPNSVTNPNLLVEHSNQGPRSFFRTVFKVLAES